MEAIQPSCSVFLKNSTRPHVPRDLHMTYECNAYAATPGIIFAAFVCFESVPKPQTWGGLMAGTNSEHAQHQHILVIEDDEGIREMLHLFLELEGYTVFTATQGRDGLEILKTMPRPCLILLDLMMPVMNGWEFVDAIQEIKALATIPIVIVTAYGNKVGPIKAQGVITKPIALDALLHLVKNSCGEPKGATE